MKKLLVIVVAWLMVACATPTVNQTELYGVVEDVIPYNGHYRAKVWCEKKGKYLNVLTAKIYRQGDVVHLK